MIKAKIYQNLLSFFTIRRGNWYIKVSAFKTGTVLVVSQHCYEQEKVSLNFFMDHNKAADYLEELAKDDYEY